MFWRVITYVACFGVVITVYFGVIIYLIPLIDRRGHLFDSSERFSLDLYDNFMKTCVLFLAWSLKCILASSVI